MQSCKTALPLAVFAVALAGCQPAGSDAAPDAGSSSHPDGSSTSDTSSTPDVADTCADQSAPIVITDPTNYALSDSFDIKTFTLKDATNLTFDWSNLTTDFFGKSLDPRKDINLILITLWHLTPSAIEADLQKDDIPLAQNAGVVTFYPDGNTTSAKLNDFTLLGQTLPTDLIPLYFDTSTPDYAYPQDAFTFMLMASTGTTLGKNARGIALFHVDPNASDDQLQLNSDTTQLSYQVDLERAQPVHVASGKSSLTIDFSQMSTNMLGNTYDWSQISRAAVAHFKSASLDDLQSRFLDLETLADEWYTTSSIAGSSVDLGTLADGNGNKFPGIDDAGIWMTALFCDNCNNPAPWSITIMQPCP